MTAFTADALTSLLSKRSNFLVTDRETRYQNTQPSLAKIKALLTKCLPWVTSYDWRVGRELLAR